MADRQRLSLARRRLGLRTDVYRFSGLKSPGGIDADFAVDFDAPRVNEAPHLAPRLAGEPGAQDGGEGLLGVFGGDVEAGCVLVHFGAREATAHRTEAAPCRRA